MNKNFTLILFFVLVALSIFGFIYYKNKYTPRYNWSENYKRSSDQPFGLKVFYNIVKDQSTELIFVNDQSYEKLDTNSVNSNFIYVGDEFWVDSIAELHMLKFAEKGNRVFIVSNYAPTKLTRNFVPVGDSIMGYDSSRDSIVYVDFRKDLVPDSKKMRFVNRYLKDTSGYYWSFYKRSYFNGEDTLSFHRLKAFSFLNDSNINSYYVDEGKGRFIVHCNPVLFTNIHMITEDGFKNAGNFLSQLHRGPTYWDEPSTMSGSNYNASARNNPLKFLFSHPYLKWAWYTFLVTLLLYLFFRSKREQRIIPLMPVNNNASIEYTKAIGTLYFLNKGHNHIAGDMYMVFLADIRHRYNISTDVPESELVDQLVVRTGISKNILYHLFKQFRHVRESTDANADELIDLYNAIENYNKKRK